MAVLCVLIVDIGARSAWRSIRGIGTAAVMGVGHVRGMVSPLLIGIPLTLGPVGWGWLILGSVQLAAAPPLLWLPMRLAVAISDPPCKRHRRHFWPHWQRISQTG